MRTRKSILGVYVLIAAFAPLLTGVAGQQDLQSRIKSLHADDIPALVTKARAGDAEAQYIVGAAYREGHGVARNTSEALVWLKKAAEQKYALAEFELSQIYTSGEGVTKDVSQGLAWLRLAANHGNAVAQFTLGYMIELQGNQAEAVKLYKKAAEQGLALAQNAIGFLYEQGKGVQDNDEAVKWYRKAAEQGDANAQSNLGSMYYQGKGVKKDLTEASRWFQKSADEGWVTGQLNLANMYVSGDGVPRDFIVAYMWYSIAAAENATAGQLMEALSSKMKSDEISDALQRAATWRKTHSNSRDIGGGVFVKDVSPSAEAEDPLVRLKTAAEKGDPEAQARLGDSYYRAKDYKEALVWFRKSADQGFDVGQYNYGVMLMEGSGTSKDEAESVKWFLKAAEQGNVGAMNNLIAAYYYGNGVPKDLASCYMWSSIAAAFGHESSKKNLPGLKQLLTEAQLAEADRRAAEWLNAHPKR